MHQRITEFVSRHRKLRKLSRLLFLYFIRNEFVWRWLRLTDHRITQESFLGRFFYPMCGVATIGVFFNNLLRIEDIPIDSAIREVFLYFLTYFVSIFVCNLLLLQTARVLRLYDNRSRWLIFCGVNLSVLVAVDLLCAMLTAIIPDFIILKTLKIFMFVPIFYGIQVYLQIILTSKIDENSFITAPNKLEYVRYACRDNRFVIFISSLVLFVVPYFVEKILEKIML